MSVYAVVAEFKSQGPILMECEGEFSSRKEADDRMRTLLAQGRVLRAALVRLEYVGGNALLLKDMERMQNDPEPEY